MTSCGSVGTDFRVLLGYGMYTTTFAVIEPWLGFGIHGLFHSILFNAMCLLAIYCHYAAMTTDPGAVPKNARPLPSDDQEFDPESGDSQNKYKKYCRRCNAFKPRRAHHCSMCGRCIVKMDHHCPWVNNCVGLGNHKLFMLFLLSVFLVSVYALVLIIAKYMSCSMRRSAKNYCGSPGNNIMVVMLLVESILFGLFTMCMMADQSDSISSNQTQIDRLKNEKFDIQTEINEVFGTPIDASFSWSWLVPVPVRFPREYVDSIYGYVLPPSHDSDNDGGDRDSELMPLTRAEGTESLESIIQGDISSKFTVDVSTSNSFKERLLSADSGPLYSGHTASVSGSSDYALSPLGDKGVSNLRDLALLGSDVGAGLGALGRTVRSNSGDSSGSLTSANGESRGGDRVKSSRPSVRKRVGIPDTGK